MSLLLYNTLSKTKEEFRPIHVGKVGMYVCGPTVYDYPHIGNWKAFLNADLLRRLLEYHGYEVRMIKNITDVGHLTRDDMSQGDTGEDKIAQRAKREQRSPEDIARFYEDNFRKGENLLNILPAHTFPRATAHIKHMIALVKTLIQKGCAYESNGNVFFDISSFPHYGELSGNTPDTLKRGTRLEDDHPDKRNQWDFALWLKAPEDHLMKWESPWSIGYPGWHIECSAMSIEYLGDRFDIHTGGEDHIFPHHEAEIAQSEGATGTHPWVNYWVHGRHVLINKEKMSKSKGNGYSLEFLAEKGYRPSDIRMTLISGHYRSQMNLTWESLDQGKKLVDRITRWIKRLTEEAIPSTEPHPDAQKQNITSILEARDNAFWEALDDDLNVPKALAELNEVITLTNEAISEKRLTSDDRKRAHKMWEQWNTVLGITLPQPESNTIPEEIRRLAEKRDNARKNKDFQTADALRHEIDTIGYLLEDTPTGFTLKKK